MKFSAKIIKYPLRGCIALSLAFFLYMPNQGNALLILDENFDSYEVGKSINDYYTGADKWALSGSAISTIGVAPNDPGSIYGNSLITQAGNGSTQSMASYKFSQVALQDHLLISFDVNILSAYAGFIYVRDSDGQYITQIVLSNATGRPIRVYHSDAEENGFTEIGTNVRNSWYRFVLDLDLRAQTYSVDIFNLTSGSTVGSLTDLMFVNNSIPDNFAIQASFNQASVFAWDNITIQTVPEVSTAAGILGATLLLLGLLYRRSRFSQADSM